LLQQKENQPKRVKLEKEIALLQKKEDEVSWWSNNKLQLYTLANNNTHFIPITYYSSLLNFYQLMSTSFTFLYPFEFYPFQSSYNS